MLTNWDDLIHGTAVFSAAVPFFIAFLIALKTPSPYWWAAAAAALFIPFLWLFKFPGFPASSEDVAIAGLIITVIVAFKQTRLLSPVLFAALVWFIYPAWLAEDGGLSRKILITLGMTAFIVNPPCPLTSDRIGDPLDNGRGHAPGDRDLVDRVPA